MGHATMVMNAETTSCNTCSCNTCGGGVGCLPQETWYAQLQGHGLL